MGLNPWQISEPGIIEALLLNKLQGRFGKSDERDKRAHEKGDDYDPQRIIQAMGEEPPKVGHVRASF